MQELQDLGVDIALFDRDKRLTVTGEIKNKRNTSADWATQLRRNTLAHGRQPPASDFFFVATPDQFYLWKNSAGGHFAGAPSIRMDARNIFATYFKRAGIVPEKASSAAFELTVAAWLGDLARSEAQRAALAAEQPLLLDSGFLDAIADGRIAYDTAA